MSSGSNAVGTPSWFTFISKSGHGAKFRCSASVTVTVFFGPIALSFLPLATAYGLAFLRDCSN